jgi:hypothetical protein
MGRTRKLKKNNPLWPYKYYAGLTPKQAAKRRKEILKFGKMDWHDPRAYVGFETDKIPVRTRKSSYTAQWDRLFPHAKSLKERSEVTGVPLKYIKKSFDRARAAWAKTGHRVGQNPYSWGYPRTSSLLLCGKVHYTADSDLVREAKRHSAKARKWFKRCKTTKLTRI